MLGGDDEDINDESLLRAIRKRLLDEISSGRSAERIVNNVYGSSPTGLVDRLNESYMGQSGEDPYEYFVDIDREDKIDPETGEKIGWAKKVRRYRDKKKVKTM